MSVRRGSENKSFAWVSLFLALVILVDYSASFNPQRSNSRWKSSALMSTTRMPNAPRKPGTMYITVGPPCSGKTTWIRSQDDKIMDISIDDQPGVYVPVDTKLFVHDGTLSPQKDGNEESATIMGKTVAERIKEQKELRLLVRRLSGLISQSEFRENVASDGSGLPEKVLCDVVEDLMKNSQEVKLPKYIDLFVFERLFQADGYSKVGAIDSAKKALELCPISEHVAWGNTNTKSRDYASALNVALRQGRPVKFVVFGGGVKVSPVLPDSTFDLNGSFEELVKRGVCRLIKTGRYIPAGRIRDMEEGSLHMLKAVVQRWKDEHSPRETMTKFDLDRGLARLNRLDLDERTRRVHAPSRHQRNCPRERSAGHPYQRHLPPGEGRGHRKMERPRGRGPGEQGRQPRSPFGAQRGYGRGRQPGRGRFPSGPRQPNPDSRGRYGN